MTSVVQSKMRAPETTPAAFLRRALGRIAGRAGMTVISVPAPLAPIDAMTDPAFADPDEPVVLWHPPEGTAFAGTGAAHLLRAEGDARFSTLRLRSRELLSSVRRIDHPRSEAPPPRLFGGLAFAPGAAAEPAFSGLGDATFVLPRFTYGRTDTRAWLSLAVDGATLDEAACEGLAAHVARIRRRLLSAPFEGPALPAVCSVSHLPPERFVRGVEGILEAIGRRRFDKVVWARRAEIVLAQAIQPSPVLARLAARHPTCTRFAIRHRGATFLGATPERLVRKRGSVIDTEALAGSVAVGEASALLGSDKDLREHRLVVGYITEMLQPLCTRVDAEPEPRLRSLADVLHMRTPITAIARPGTHVLDFVEALHPTPAVSGVPAAAALDFITTHEPAPRGWYAGPVGWLDASGDGEMCVALRSGLLRGDRAFAWAGAGIVAGSVPEAEHAETGLKMRALLDALGALDAAGARG